MTLQEMEKAITKLSPRELDELVGWLQEYYAESWDKQIEQDAASGKLDALLAEVNQEYDSGSSKAL